jgi:hypothetical protein
VADSKERGNEKWEKHSEQAAKQQTSNVPFLSSLCFFFREG